MIDITTECIALIATGLAAFSASVSAYAAIKSHSTARKALEFQRLLEKNQLQLMKNKILLSACQTLMVTFSQIQASAKDEWSSERAESLEKLGKELKSNCIVARSLSREVGKMIQQWEISIDNEGDSVSRVVHYILIRNNSFIGDKYDNFFRIKSDELNEIHEKVFQLILCDAQH